MVHSDGEPAVEVGSVTLSLDALKRAISAGFNHNRDIDCHENSFDQLLSDIMHCVRQAAVIVPANAGQSEPQWPDNICHGPIRYDRANNYDGFYLADAMHGIPTFGSVSPTSPVTIRNQHIRVFNYPGQTAAIARPSLPTE